MASVMKPRAGHKNPVLIPGVHRFGRSKMYHKRAMNIKRTLKTEPKVADKKPMYVEKPIGGAQNGGKRLVQLIKSKRYHPTAISKVGRKVNRPGVVRRPKLRGSLKPGTILILVAGRHAGKRVVFLKQLDSGLLLITGPFKLNGVPLRRINQMYVIATSTRLDISTVNIPTSLDDAYFRRDKKALRKQRKEQEGDIFAIPKSDYKPNDTRKKDQSTLDKEIMAVIKANPEKKLMCKYLASAFSLKSGQFPHKMKF